MITNFKPYISNKVCADRLIVYDNGTSRGLSVLFDHIDREIYESIYDSVYESAVKLDKQVDVEKANENPRIAFSEVTITDFRRMKLNAESYGKTFPIEMKVCTDAQADKRILLSFQNDGIFIHVNPDDTLKEIQENLQSDDHFRFLSSKLLNREYDKRFIVKEEDIGDFDLLSVLCHELVEFKSKYCKKLGIDFSSIKIELGRAHEIHSTGACNCESKTLTYAKELIYVSRDCLELTVCHELCHLVHPNHSKEFWDLLKTTFEKPEAYVKLNEDLGENHFALGICSISGEKHYHWR